MSKKLEILYEDSDLVIVNKPSGLLSIGDRFNLNAPSLLSRLRKKYGEVFTVHRLDKETSGVIVYALNKEVHKDLSLQFEQRETTKKYLAFVEGTIADKGIINEPIAESPFIKGKMVVHKKGKPSLTHFTTIQRYGNIALLDIDLKTGRTHQIRVHFAHIGNPLFIDAVYGNRADFFLSELKGRKYRSGKNQIERPLLKRLTLHASMLSFEHPVSKQHISIESPLPKELKALQYQLDKFYKNKD